MGTIIVILVVYYTILLAKPLYTMVYNMGKIVKHLDIHFIIQALLLIGFTVIMLLEVGK